MVSKKKIVCLCLCGFIISTFVGCKNDDIEMQKPSTEISISETVNDNTKDKENKNTLNIPLTIDEIQNFYVNGNIEPKTIIYKSDNVVVETIGLSTNCSTGTELKLSFTNLQNDTLNIELSHLIKINNIELPSIWIDSSTTKEIDSIVLKENETVETILRIRNEYIYSANYTFLQKINTIDIQNINILNTNIQNIKNQTIETINEMPILTNEYNNEILNSDISGILIYEKEGILIYAKELIYSDYLGSYYIPLVLINNTNHYRSILFDNVKYNLVEEDNNSSNIFIVGESSVEFGALFLDNKDFEKEDIIELSICSYEEINEQETNIETDKIKVFLSVI